jgi:hypothetical protein
LSEVTLRDFQYEQEMGKTKSGKLILILLGFHMENAQKATEK